MTVEIHYDANTGKTDFIEREVRRKNDRRGNFYLDSTAMPRRKRWWTVTVRYTTPSGPQELVVKPSKKCFLTQLSTFIDAAMREDIAKTGDIKDITWTAIGR